MLAAHHNLVVDDGRYAGYGESSFYDLSHRHAADATELTSGLAEALRPYLFGTAATRPKPWASLPPFRGLRRDQDLEDIEQSKLAVSPDDSTRR